MSGLRDTRRPPERVRKSDPAICVTQGVAYRVKMLRDYAIPPDLHADDDNVLRVVLGTMLDKRHRGAPEAGKC
jgi:hypothetical protein